MTGFKKLPFIFEILKFLNCFCPSQSLANFLNRHSWFLLSYFKELDFKELAFKELGVLGYSDLLGMGVLGYSDLLGLGVPKEIIRRRLFEGDYARRLSEGDYSKETIRRSGAHDI